MRSSNRQPPRHRCACKRRKPEPSRLQGPSMHEVQTAVRPRRAFKTGWRPIVPIRIRQSWGCERFSNGLDRLDLHAVRAPATKQRTKRRCAPSGSHANQSKIRTAAFVAVALSARLCGQCNKMRSSKGFRTVRCEAASYAAQTIASVCTKIGKSRAFHPIFQEIRL